uniref:Uncharacterized protein n=1 Tax=Romanomermis culicivorax TaxID=13658 RepID=A0A915I9Z3_ROMCU
MTECRGIESLRCNANNGYDHPNRRSLKDMERDMPGTDGQRFLTLSMSLGALFSGHLADFRSEIYLNRTLPLLDSWDRLILESLFLVNSKYSKHLNKTSCIK